MNRRYGDGAAIAARATAPGEAALAVIRTSGEKSLDLLAAVFSRPKTLLEAPGNTAIHGWIIEPGTGGVNGGEARRIDEVIVSAYRAPASYTGEDGADISCHGGGAAVNAALETLIKAGFARALPGEFTFRAFMNGKLDLTRAESVMELVSAKTGAAACRAVRRLSGALENELAGIRNKLIEALAAAEIRLDYPDDEIDADENAGGAASPFAAIRENAAEALAALETLAASYRRERLYAEGALAVIAGRPNAGKSSLFNALLGEDRSIVTEIPGTTRDWIEAQLSLDGIPIRLADTAGLREHSGGGDPVEALGIRRSRELLDEADITIYVIDGEAGLNAEDARFLETPPEKTLIPVWNKADLAAPGAAGGGVIPVSAKTGAGVAELCSAITASLVRNAGETPEGAGIGTKRQKDLIDRASSSLREAIALLETGAPELELAASSLRAALDAIGEITGDVSTADILESMFSRFCVGK